MCEALVLDYAGVLTDPDAADLLAVVSALRKRGIRTALLSNAGSGEGVKRGLAAYFDAFVFSGEVGFAKPSTEVYRLTAERLGVSTVDCVFVDDVHANVAGAVAVGMVGVHHVSVAATLAELNALFV
ncbi:MAG TPA: HAD-IA family hydrolase [Amycolatopsis sp.]|uniref:HAD-IA family hydrolase n=1 Tax=Amycolatopsis sp. TaxID=37632 RepID=UPI002B4A6DA5|nr:HAD-IA family hydrolase [Amycolatopsis sp.]HKS44767.1 HAD-IA family hydrolase [Amycolatopsis sp.]